MNEDKKQPIVAVVLPCYDESLVLDSSAHRILDLLREMTCEGLVSAESVLLMVDDGSRDNTWDTIKQISAQNVLSHGVKLSSNRGHQNALLAGMERALDRFGADAVITIDADLQDDPNVMKQMIHLMNEGNDVVLGVRKSRTSDSFFKRTTSHMFYRFMSWLGADVVYNHADYRLLSRRAVEAVLQYGERNMFLRGIVNQMGFRQAKVYYDRTARTAGETKYPFKKMVNFAIDGITSFSVKPVRMVLGLGLLFILMAVFQLVYVLYSYFSNVAVSGWSSLMLSLWFVGGCILLSLGVIGEYVAKIYIETKQRPRFHIEDEV